MNDSPIACSLDDSALAARQEGLLAALARMAISRAEIPGGIRVIFASSSEALTLAARVIDAERQCCRFLRFQLTIEPDLGEIVLECTGPAGTAQFLSDLLNIPK